MHLLDRKSHACDLIVKVPLTEAAKRAIAHEAQTLIELQREGFEPAPRLVVLDSHDGVASQTVVHGSRALMRYSTRQPLCCKRSSFRTNRRRCGDAMSSVEQEAGRLELSPADMALLSSALNAIDDCSQLPAVRVHGDFAPWNIRLQNGSAALVDWEDSRAHGLPLYDAYHFVHMTRCLFGKRPQSVAQELRFRYCCEFGNSLRWKLESRSTWCSSRPRTSAVGPDVCSVPHGSAAANDGGAAMTVCASEHSGVQSLRVAQQPEATRYSSGDLEVSLFFVANYGRRWFGRSTIRSFRIAFWLCGRHAGACRSAYGFAVVPLF